MCTWKRTVPMMRAAVIFLLAGVVACEEALTTSSPTAPSAGPVLSALEVDPSVRGGQAARATVTLSGPAPPQGVAISLIASGAAATVPASVTVPGDATSATFDVATARVTVTTDV